MRLACATTVFLAILVLAAFIGSSHEDFYEEGAAAETNMDRLCKIVDVIHIENADVARLCAQHKMAQGRDFCVKGCDPASLCGLPAVAQCVSGSKRCDVTHEFVGPHISSFNDHLPRFFVVKHGFCVRLHVGIAMQWSTRVDAGVVDVMLAFPKSIMLPQVDEHFHELSKYWTLDTSMENFDIPFAESPERPEFLWGQGLKRPANPVKNPAFAIYETSTGVDGNRTWRETSVDEIEEMVNRDMRERRPASPDRMVFTFFKRFENGETAKNGFHEYKLENNVFQTYLLPDITLPAAPVSLVVSATVDMKNGGSVVEVREIVFCAGVYKLARKILDSPPVFRQNYEFDGFRYFLGSLDPDSCKKLVSGM